MRGFDLGNGKALPENQVDNLGVGELSGDAEFGDCGELDVGGLAFACLPAAGRPG